MQSKERRSLEKGLKPIKGVRRRSTSRYQGGRPEGLLQQLRKCDRGRDNEGSGEEEGQR